MHFLLQAKLVFCGLLLFMAACQTRTQPANITFMQQPRATVTRIIRLENVPSASGMEVLDSCLYVVSDDSPLLFRFTLGYAPLAPVNLFKSAFSVGARIPKAEKPDLEALTLLRVNGELHLLAIGKSGPGIGNWSEIG